jgi:hypothetical protein
MDNQNKCNRFMALARMLPVVLSLMFFHGQVLGVSGVFTGTVKQEIPKFNVSLDNQTYHPHQNIVFDIAVKGSFDRLVEQRKVTFTFVDIGTTRRDLDNRKKILDVFTRPWSKTGRYHIMNTMVKKGFYKVFVEVTSVKKGKTSTLYAMKVFRVLEPLIVMTTRPKRRSYIQGEVIDFDFYNPYFNFSLSLRDYIKYVSYVVEDSFPRAGDPNPTLPDNSLRYDYLPVGGDEYHQNLRIVLPAGKYKLAIFRSISGQLEQYVTTIPNSGFTIENNKFKITTDKNKYKKGENIHIELSSSRNIPLPLVPPIDYEMTIKKNDNPNYIGAFHVIGFFNVSTSTTLLAVINISWNSTGVFTFKLGGYGAGRGFGSKDIVIYK